MGLFGAIRKNFDRGGVGLKLELPRSFSWDDGVIPATVTITGHNTEPRRINGLRFEVIDDEQNDDTSTVHVRFDHDWRTGDPIELAAGQEETFQISIPVPARKSSEEAAEEAFGRPASGFLEKAFTAAVRGVSPERISRYLVTVIAPVEGASKPKRAKKHIRQGRSIAGGTLTSG